MKEEEEEEDEEEKNNTCVSMSRLATEPNVESTRRSSRCQVEGGTQTRNTVETKIQD